MKNINWSIRFKNKTWLASFIALIVSFVYQVLSMFNVVPSVSQDIVLQLVSVVLTVLSGIGVIQDPTTSGVKDSARALNYVEPGKGPAAEGGVEDDSEVGVG